MPVLDSPAVARFDAAVDAWFERHLRGVTLADRAFYTASALADHSLLWHLLGAAGAARPRRSLVGAVRLSSALGVESLLVNGAMKSFFRRERPVHEAVRPHALRTPRTSSFPSGHASSAFLAAVLLTEGPVSGLAVTALASTVAASRIHVRIHYASDVLGGVAVGVAMGLAARRLWPLRSGPSVS